MGFVSDMFNSSKGAGWQAQNADLQKPTTAAQATSTYNTAQNGLQGQQQFLQALQAQNGLGNQSSVFNQLQGVANGTGPNPAQAQLAQATAANTANQASLMAGQRGAGTNVGLMARQAGQQGAANQQNMAGQAATMQANQSLNALNNLGGLANQQVANQMGQTNAYSQAAQGEQSNILNAIAQQNNAAVGAASSMNSANAGIAGINATGQQNLLGGITGGAGAALGLAHGGKVQNLAAGGFTGLFGTNNTDPNATANSQSSALNQMNGSNKNPNQPGATPRSGVGQYFKSGGPGGSSNTGGLLGGALGSGIKALGGLFGSKTPDAAQGPQGAPISNTTTGADNIKSNALTGPDDAAPAMTGDAMVANKGGKVPAMVSPGEKYLNPEEAQAVAKGKADLKNTGKTIPGKAKVKGDSLKNDTVPATLESGGLVIPRTQMKDWSSAMKFVHAHMAKERALAHGGKVKKVK